MLFVVVVFQFFAATAGFKNGWNRISAGNLAHITAYRSMLSLEIYIPGDSFRHDHYVSICGAVIIAKNWALTSAQCFLALDDVQLILRAGSNFDEHGGKVYNVIRVMVNPSYTQMITAFSSNPVDDIALCQVSPHFPTSDLSIKRASLPPANYKILPEVKGIAIGWGRVSKFGEGPRVLHVAEVVTLDMDVCDEQYEYFFFEPKNTCASGLQTHTGVCDGDYGVPLFIDDMVVAISSWSVGCGDTSRPDVYTQIAPYRNWIDNILQST